ncbi:DUF1003 domain-containing protein [Novosphingobium cyanobacteriorum]|uniref:DUF1003 domain-containing protein n=1 Tax=Novosphingobium cyanobacteriorum TaxID=3024215 RepID=A0ABT6CEC9_9SPHN|nr:DUF1003 domain-containing protein [Novosphingobium cyanobacteriorum]MDF8332270.1 DUF1003 domain-containing protein [Novosphingobium cyanobacteriorum]
MKLDISPEALAEDLLGRSYDDLDEAEQRALCRVASTDIQLDPDELEQAREGLGERLADRVARVGGSWSFIIGFGLVLAAWMLVNGPLSPFLHLQWDAYPYIFLNLMLSTLAAFQAPIIMMSQNREARKDRISNRHDYEVNLRTTVEILRLHRKVDKIFNKLGQLDRTVEEVAVVTESAVEMAIDMPPPDPSATPAQQAET